MYVFDSPRLLIFQWTVGEMMEDADAWRVASGCATQRFLQCKVCCHPGLTFIKKSPYYFPKKKNRKLLIFIKFVQICIQEVSWEVKNKLLSLRPKFSSC